MRTVQQIFNLVIENGFYTSLDNPFMCISIRSAYLASLITKEEKNKAEQAIAQYMDFLRKKNNSISFSNMLYFNLFLIAKIIDRSSVGFRTTKWIYSNWSSRPKSAKQIRELIERFQVED